MSVGPSLGEPCRYERARPFSSREGRTAGPERRLARRSGEGLATQAQALNQCTVALNVNLLEVTQEATTLADKEKKSTTRVVVVLVNLAVLGEVEDALREHRDLNLGRTGVTLVGGVLGHDGLLN